ncbi:cation:proton antiporter [Salinispirillum marinum]|uniref:Cation:proton antiporter n=2 Tax=Saccharospirillaceae TaxID=255527 RepID=A0ABV8BFH8_9GAMM
MEPAFLLYAFVGGMLAMIVRLPPLAGFLAAGFVLNWQGYELTTALDSVADLGVTLLLFTIGLKLNVKLLLRPEVWGVATLHMVLSSGGFLVVFIALKALGVMLFQNSGWTNLLVLGFALSFSSTVFAVKVLEDRSETQSLYGRVAIGVLIMQDIFAVLFLTASTGALPSPWALALVLLIPVAPVFRRLLERLGHGEMQVLFGFLFALVLGYQLFETVGIKGDLGALVMGVLLAPHAAAGGLAKALFNIKELFLVGFFLSIGLTALPTWEHVGWALLLVVAIPLKSWLFLMMFSRFRLRIRTSVLATLSLGNFSEFGLIVAALALSEGWLSADWLVILSLAVAFSFVLGAVLNQYSEALYCRLRPFLREVAAHRLNAHDRPIEIGDAQVVVLGMGRMGRGAYDRLTQEYGLKVLGVDSNAATVEKYAQEGLRVLEGDAVDSDFWDKLLLSEQIDLVMLAMPHHAGNLFAIDQLRGRSFKGKIAAIVEYADEAMPLKKRGADAVFYLYDEAGVAFADSAMAELKSHSVAN